MFAKFQPQYEANYAFEHITTNSPFKPTQINSVALLPFQTNSWFEKNSFPRSLTAKRVFLKVRKRELNDNLNSSSFCLAFSLVNVRFSTNLNCVR